MEEVMEKKVKRIGKITLDGNKKMNLNGHRKD